MITYNRSLYKAVKPDGTDFYSGTVQWAPPDRGITDWLVKHPDLKAGNVYPNWELTSARRYLSVSTKPTDCTGAQWPCRLLLVRQAPGQEIAEPHGNLPHKRAALAWMVTGEIQAHRVFGPNGDIIVRYINKIATMKLAQMRSLSDSIPKGGHFYADPLLHNLGYASAGVMARDAVANAMYAAIGNSTPYRDTYADAYWSLRSALHRLVEAEMLREFNLDFHVPLRRWWNEVMEG